MNDELMKLAKHAVTLLGWRWMPGMLVITTHNYHRPARIESLDGDTYGLTVIPHADGPVFAGHHEYGITGEFPRGSSVPDLSDPATLGCLLALVREAWGKHTIVDYARYGWSVYAPTGDAVGASCKSEAHALVAALEAAPTAEAP